MDLIYRLITLVLIGGLIGYSTNKVAIRMLFRPLEVKRVLWFKIQGVLPKRKSYISKGMGEAIELAFVTKDDIAKQLMTDGFKQDFKTMLKEKLTDRIKARVPVFFQSMLGEDFDQFVHKIIDTESDALMDSIIENMKEKTLKQLDIAGIVTEKVNQMDLVAFEQLVIKIVKKELGHIELVGLILGMLIGCIQFVLTTWVL